MSNIKIVKDFNNQLIDLLQQFVSITNDKDIKIYQILLKGLIAKNCLMPIENFKEYVLPYKEKIYNQDDDYFLTSEDYLKNVKSEQSLLKALKLKEIYKMLNDDGKQNLWNYLKILCFYSEQY
jgi:hypothetical protein